MAKRETLAMAMATRVLFVCMGNICRSPMAHGVFRQQVRQAGLESVVGVGSAGTHAFHQGEPADPRAQMAMSRRGYDIADLRSTMWKMPVPACSRSSAGVPRRWRPPERRERGHATAFRPWAVILAIYGGARSCAARAFRQGAWLPQQVPVGKGGPYGEKTEAYTFFHRVKT